MFKSFFPRPGPFFLSALIWTALCVVGWYTIVPDLGAAIGFPPDTPGAEPIIDLGYFVTPQFIWFYLYVAAAVTLFTGAWMALSPHPWQWWSIPGSALIVFADYVTVQVNVVLNNWQRPFGDAIQNALDPSATNKPTSADFYHLFWIFAQVAFAWVGIYVAIRFFTSHFVFRWRTAMNNYYMSRWPEVRTIEGAAQRVQEDTMRFATIVEDLGVSVLDAIMTLFAFLPVLVRLSKDVTELPLVGHVPEPLLLASIFWATFGTFLLAVAGIRLPGLAFHNQRVEAAYRKELVYGEDDAQRASPLTARELFFNVRRAYFRYYFHYAYFNVFRAFYIQADNIFAYVILVPTIVAGKITLGVMNQILNVFSQVSYSFQYLVNSWTTIIELQSIRKRLKAFEAAFEGRAQDAIERQARRA